MPLELFKYANSSGSNTIVSTFSTNDAWARRLKPAQRRLLYRGSLEAALRMWRAEFLRKRIEKDSVSRPPFDYKRGGNSPMIGKRRQSDPSKLLNAVWTGRVNARVPTATKETDPIQVSATVAFPFGHAVHIDIVRVFRTLPPNEAAWIANKFAELVASERGQLETIERGRGRGNVRLSPEQRARLRTPPRASNRATPRRG